MKKLQSRRIHSEDILDVIQDKLNCLGACDPKDIELKITLKAEINLLINLLRME